MVNPKLGFIQSFQNPILSSHVYPHTYFEIWQIGTFSISFGCLDKAGPTRSQELWADTKVLPGCTWVNERRTERNKEVAGDLKRRVLISVASTAWAQFVARNKTTATVANVSLDVQRCFVCESTPLCVLTAYARKAFQTYSNSLFLQLWLHDKFKSVSSLGSIFCSIALEKHSNENFLFLPDAGNNLW